MIARPDELTSEAIHELLPVVHDLVLDERVEEVPACPEQSTPHPLTVAYGERFVAIRERLEREHGAAGRAAFYDAGERIMSFLTLATSRMA
jgi:hypothetical protein